MGIYREGINGISDNKVTLQHKSLHMGYSARSARLNHIGTQPTKYDLCYPTRIPGWNVCMTSDSPVMSKMIGYQSNIIREK